jgi:hypothetical protein
VTSSAGAGGASTFLQQAHPFVASSSSSSLSTPYLSGSSNDYPALPFLSSSMLPQADIPLKRMDYPGIRFWTRSEWMIHLKNDGDTPSFGTEGSRGRTLVSRGINKTAKYIEDANGNAVDGYQLKDMLTHMRSIWSGLLLVNRAPATWGKADVDILRHFHCEMRVKFSEFAFCENDWKADYLASTHYPSWYSNHVRGVMIKEAEEPGADRAGRSKRPAVEQSTASEPKIRKKKVSFVRSQ